MRVDLETNALLAVMNDIGQPSAENAAQGDAAYGQLALGVLAIAVRSSLTSNRFKW